MTNNTNTIIDRPLDEQNDEVSSNEDLFNITSWGADLSFRELIAMYNDNELTKPEIQRKYVWSKFEASRFIESILMGLPVPSIFLYKQHNNKYLIIDGFQRIMSIFEFVEKGIFSGDKSIFALSNSKRLNERWRNKTFNQLSEEEQRKIKTYIIHAIIFEQKLPKGDTSLFQIFERINTGGRSLNDQEIRNCVYQGPFNKELLKANNFPDWRELYDKNNEEDNRMLDIELILRFVAMYSLDLDTIEKRSISLKTLLNSFMKNNQYADNENLINIFKKTVSFLKNNIGDNVFVNYNFENNKNMNTIKTTIFDAIMIATAKYKKEGFANLAERRYNLLKDPKFIEYSSNRTTDTISIRNRINLAANYLYDANLDII